MLIGKALFEVQLRTIPIELDPLAQEKIHLQASLGYRPASLRFTRTFFLLNNNGIACSSTINSSVKTALALMPSYALSSSAEVPPGSANRYFL
ncbi:hypothetical protein [Xanthomonas euvesicatoria]|uniref:hypothetical protein n=1 Tax=Xanthomonas euvesicatoria TaxID=456327 RepID=UPI0038919940